MPFRECNQPRCPNYATKHGYCDDHQQTYNERGGSNTDSRLDPTNRFFRRARRAFLNEHPICNHCKRHMATVLDHIRPHRGIASLYWDRDNWQGLCVWCHGLKTALETLQSRFD